LKACPDWAKNTMAQNLRVALTALVAAQKAWPKRNPATKPEFITHHGWPI
jgi:hypothetical protein